MADSVTFDNWDFRAQQLSSKVGETGNRFVTSESTLLLATQSATFTDGLLTGAKAVALAQNLGFSQQPQMMQVHEIGSNKKYTLRSGRTMQNLSISRALFHGDSLIKALAPEQEGGFSSRRDHPGFGPFMINLASSIFSKPIGLFVIFRDLDNQNVGGFFCEETFIQAHSMQANAQSPLIMESLQLVFNSVIPVRLP